jgi:DNA polymerase-3 subunit alpha
MNLEREYERQADTIRRQTTCSLATLQQCGNGAQVIFCGWLEALKILKTRSSGPMAIGELVDPTGRLEVILFPDVYRRNRRVLGSDRLLRVTGELQLESQIPPKLMVEEVSLFE